MTEHRRLYLQQYRKKHRARIREQSRDYLRNYMRTYRRGNFKGFLGKCGMGRKFEKVALSFLVGSTDCNEDSFHGKWDIEWNSFKIDVKSRKLNSNNYYQFTDKNKVADYLLCFCVNDKEEILKIVFIPNKAFNKGFVIHQNKKTKWSKYIVNLNFFTFKT